MSLNNLKWCQSIYALFILAVCLLFAQGCIRLIADYDAKTEDAIFASAKAVDKFYFGLLEVDESERRYSKYSHQYVEIEAELNSLVLRNKVRNLNADSTDIVERILKLWQKYKKRHKDKDAYRSGVAKLERKRFQRMFAYAVRAEGAKKATGTVE